MADKTIIDLLKEDHREFESLFEKYPSDPQGTFKHLKRDLTMHTELEEEVLYPVIAEYAQDKVLHARHEHEEAAALLASLAEDPSNMTVFRQLQDGVNHHIAEEEGSFFDEVRKDLDEQKLVELGQQGEDVKARILAELKK